MEGCCIQELLSLLLAISPSVVVTNEVVLVWLAREVTLITLVVVVDHISVGFVKQGVLELTEALHDDYRFRRLENQRMESKKDLAV